MQFIYNSETFRVPETVTIKSQNSKITELKLMRFVNYCNSKILDHKNLTS